MNHLFLILAICCTLAILTFIYVVVVPIIKKLLLVKDYVLLIVTCTLVVNLIFVVFTMIDALIKLLS